MALNNIPPTIRVDDHWRYFDNLQPITLENQKSKQTKYIQYALQEGIDSIMTPMSDGSLGYRIFVTWHVWKQQLEGFVPQINCKVTDQNGNNWYVANVNYDVWGNKFLLDTELEAGQVLKTVNLPVTTSTTTSTSTSSTTLPPTTSSTTTSTSSSTTTSSTTSSSTTTQAPLVVLPVSLNDGTQGQFYSVQFSVQ